MNIVHNSKTVRNTPLLLFSLLVNPICYLNNLNIGTAKEEFVVLFSAPVAKWNKYTIKQERTLVVTNLNLYNFHKKSK